MASKVTRVSTQIILSLPEVVDETLNKIKQTALAIIRQVMPIETLFNFELKINLDGFVKDQMLFYRLAEFISQCTADNVVEKLSASEFVTPYKETLHYLQLFHEACIDVLKNPISPTHLKAAIEGRIYTLKNALIAQHSPEAILKSQTRKQTKEAIQAEGKQFIRETLALYVNLIKAPKEPSFREELISVAEQLVPFVRKVTKMYIEENGYECPADPLTFRNPTGYNYHGFIAATVMEASLNALGYKTQFLAREDLEPRVTLAVMHALVRVTDPKGVHYLIDPTYIQFHKDVCLKESDLPSKPVLVLQESETDGHVEKLMIHWKRNYTLVKHNEPGIRELLEKQDRLLSLTIDEEHFSYGARSIQREDWVRQALKCLFHLPSYHAGFPNAGFHEIFSGSGKKKMTFEQIKPLGLAAMTNHLPLAEIAKKLEQLKSAPALQHKNDLGALSTLLKVSVLERDKYDALFDLDPRLNPPVQNFVNAYYRSIKKIVNPESQSLSVVYGCSGPDCTSILYATDATELFFIDCTELKLEKFQGAVQWLQDPEMKKRVHQFLEFDRFFTGREMHLSSAHLTDNAKHFMHELETKLIFNLQAMGVDLSQMKLSSIENGIVLEFPWQYYGSTLVKQRKLTCLTAKLEEPAQYPVALKQKLEAGIDIFYMKSAGDAPLFYPQFLPLFAKALKAGGFLMTADRAQGGIVVNPDPLLQQHQMTFLSKSSEETFSLEKLMHPQFGPFCKPFVLNAYPNPSQRKLRNIASNATYHTLLTIRQKKS